jgi:hypothetical protein
MGKALVYALLIIGVCLCIVGIIICGVDYTKYRDYKKSIIIQEIKILKCTPNYNNFYLCNYTDGYCIQYNVTFTIETICKDPDIITIEIVPYIPLDQIYNYCNITHACNYKCSNINETLNLYPPVYPDMTAQTVITVLSIIGLTICIMIFIIYRMRPPPEKEHNPEYEQVFDRS